MAERSRRRKLGMAAAVLAGLIVVVALAALVVVVTIDAEPGDVAVAALASDDQVTVTRDGGAYRMEPTGPTEPSCVGLVFHPGGLVEGEAYAAHLRPLAEAGHPVFVVDPPLNLAVLDADAAAAVIDANPAIATWSVAGHSLGGAMAARFAARTPDRVDGLVLWAAFPPDGDDLSGTDVAVASIYGTEDGLATVDEVLGAGPLLPDDAGFVAIDGGNHAQFGDYGDQRGDRPALIGAEEQRRAVAGATLELLQRLDDDHCPTS